MTITLTSMLVGESESNKKNKKKTTTTKNDNAGKQKKSEKKKSECLWKQFTVVAIIIALEHNYTQYKFLCMQCCVLYLQAAESSIMTSKHLIYIVVTQSCFVYILTAFMQYKFLLSVLCNVDVFNTIQQLISSYHNTIIHVYSINSYLVYYSVLLQMSVLYSMSTYNVHVY